MLISEGSKVGAFVPDVKASSSAPPHEGFGNESQLPAPLVYSGAAPAWQLQYPPSRVPCVPHAAWTPKKKVRERTRTTRARALIVTGREKGNKKRKKKQAKKLLLFLLEYYLSQIIGYYGSRWGKEECNCNVASLY
jgi:hypothetical protein